MKELNEYRTHLMDRLLSATREFCEACMTVPDPIKSIEAHAWNTHQIATHTRDVHVLVYRFRAQRTAEEHDPEFQNFDGDAYMAEHYDATEPLNKILDGFMASIEAFVINLKRLPTDAWSRTSRHATFGNGFTLQTWVERDLAHIEEHLKAIKSTI